MKAFADLTFDLLQCRAELTDLQVMLEGSATLTEREDILPFFNGHRHLSALVGMYNPDISRFDRIAFEYDIFGDFACDLVVGDSVKGQYCFVEFENASPGCLFKKKRGKATPEWAPRFDHGYSQIIDWFWKLDDMRQTNSFHGRFGGPVSGYVGILVIGRDKNLDSASRERLNWRRKHVVVNSNHINVLTLDQLHADLASRLSLLFSLATEFD